MDEFTIKDINGLVYDQGKLYMVSHYISFIMAYDFETKKVEKLCNYPQDVTETGAFEKIIKQESKIYLFPCFIDSIYCYDMRIQEYTDLLSLHSISDKVPTRKFFEVRTYDGFIYAVCRLPQFVIRINPANNDVRIWKLEQEILISERIVLADFSVEIYGGKIIYPYGTDILIEFSIYEETFQIIQLEREQDDYDEKYRCLLGITVDDIGAKWVFDWYGNVFEIIQDKMIKIIMPPELDGVYDDGQYEEAPRINTILAHGGRLHFLLQSDNRILIYDVQKHSFSWMVNALTEWKSARRRLAYVEYTQVNADTFLIYNYNDGKIYVWNRKDGFSKRIELNMVLQDVSDDKWLKNCVLAQGDLELYLQYIKKSITGKVEEEKKCFGQNIYFALTGESMT